MAGSSIKTVAVAAGIALGSSGAVILITGLFIGMLLLSIIPVYISDNSVPGYGEIYRIPGLAIKAIYTNLTATNFTGGSVLNLQDLSTICTAILRAKNVQNVYACVATNFTAYGPTADTGTNTVSRRRRNLNDVGLYEVGDILILFSNTCSNRRARLQWFSALTSNQNSSCLAQRAAACRAFITTPNNLSGSSSNQWSPFPNGYTQLVYTNGSSCAAISISYIYNVATSLYGSINSLISRYNNITRTASYYPGDCRFEDIRPQSYLANIVASAMNPTMPICSSIVTG